MAELEVCLRSSGVGGVRGGINVGVGRALRARVPRARVIVMRRLVNCILQSFRADDLVRRDPDKHLAAL
jgi:hypothetical protein